MNSKIILITGGTSGIGASMLKILQEENTVIVCGRSQSKIDTVKSKYPKSTFIQADISKAADLERIYELINTKFGKLDVLINNAGVAHFVDLNEGVDSNQFMDIEVNFKSTVLTTNKLLPLLRKSKDKKPTIVIVSSILAKIPQYEMPIYSASKAALHSYTLSLRSKLKDFQITEVLPPLVDTPLVATIDNADKMDSDKVASIIVKGMIKGKKEIYPGIAKVANLVSKISFSRIAKLINT